MADLESAAMMSGLITQNVDGLHGTAGNRSAVELHGNLSRVVCLDCRGTEQRSSVQERVLILNPDWMRYAGDVAPDGDVHLPEQVTRRFAVPACLKCGGVLKPDVVFFGESVPRSRVDAAFDFLSKADVLLVLGSSLTVYSGFRFADRAVKDGKPLIIINDGPTRADGIATMKVEARLGEMLDELRGELGLRDSPPELSQEDSNPHRRSQIP